MKRALGVIGLSAIAYVAGLYSGYERDGVLQSVLAMKRSIVPRSGDVDEYERTVRTDRPPIPCPPQTRETLVVVVAGQSNAASLLSRRHAGAPRVVSYFRGQCYAAVDPIVGSSGRGGSVWVEMANLLGRDVVLIPMAVPATRIEEWNGRLAPLVEVTLRDAKQRYAVTHVAWMHGEADAGVTQPAVYRAELQKLIARTRAVFPGVKFYVSQTTHCFGVQRDEGIRAAQKAVVDAARGVLPGPDTDRFIAMEDRSDDCHLAEAGQAKVAREWARVLGAADQAARMVSRPPM